MSAQIRPTLVASVQTLAGDLMRSKGSGKFLALVLASSFVHSSCASGPSRPRETVSNRETPSVVEGLPAIEVAGAALLRLSAQAGRVEVTKHASRSVSKSFDQGKLKSLDESSAQFEVRTEIRDRPDGTIEQWLQTTKKSGDLDLRSLAFPEEGEKLGLLLTRQGRVLSAGEYPPDSIFFVPPVSLPAGPVAVGDTWELVAQWKNFEDDTPFQLEMVSILKGYVACGDDQCADVELSGEVKIPFEMRKFVGFDSEWRGRMLFAKNSGSLVWSRIDSLETMRGEGVERRIHSCLESVLAEPAALQPKTITGPTCEDGRMPPAFRMP